MYGALSILVCQNMIIWVYIQSLHVCFSPASYKEKKNIVVTSNRSGPALAV